MHVESVNAGRAELMKIGARMVSTGIRKAAVERGHVGTLGLAGDVVADEENHGGPDQAIYLYSSEDYSFWAAELGGLPAPGTFGENLTLSSFGPEAVRIGDRYRVGEALLEVTAPRIPCAVFATRMGEADWVRRFADARRPGLYVLGRRRFSRPRRSGQQSGSTRRLCQHISRKRCVPTASPCGSPYLVLLCIVVQAVEADANRQGSGGGFGDSARARDSGGG